MKTVKFTMFVTALFLLSGCNWFTLVNVNSAGDQANDHTDYRSSMSDDGRYVAFISRASNLVPGDTNGFSDIFVRDLATGTTTRVSVDSTGMEANGDSGLIEGEVSISANGRYVGFRSVANNLVVGDANNLGDIFVHDRATGATTLVSVDSAGTQANDESYLPAISGDGRYVSFCSNASNLVEGDTNNVSDVFVHDRLSGNTTRISLGNSGEEANDHSFSYSLSGDGRFVVFNSVANNLVEGDTNGLYDAFVRDRQTGTTTRVSVSSTGEQTDFGSILRPSISRDGRYVVFKSLASNLVAGDTNDRNDIFVHDRDTGITTRVSVSSTGMESNGWSGDESISANGRYVAFTSVADNLVANDTNGQEDAFVHDRYSGSTTRVSVDSMGIEGEYRNFSSSISGDGRYVAFGTLSTNIVPNDANGYQDLVIRGIPDVTVTSVTPDVLPIGKTKPVTIAGTNFLPGATPFMDGAEISNVVIEDEGSITADITISAGAAEGLQDIQVGLPGTGPGTMAGVVGTCADCVTFTAINCGCGCP